MYTEVSRAKKYDKIPDGGKAPVHMVHCSAEVEEGLYFLTEVKIQKIPVSDIMTKKSSHIFKLVKGKMCAIFNEV